MYEYLACKPPNLHVPERSVVYTSWGIAIVQASFGQYILIIPKYVFCDRGTPLYSKPAASNLDRIVWYYTPREIGRFRLVDEACIGPGYYTTTAEFMLVCNPRERVHEVLENPRDELEYTTSRLVTDLSLEDSVGLTGSLGGYYHNPLVSDIDLVVYVDLLVDPYEAVDSLRRVLKPLPHEDIMQWSRRRCVSPKLYRHWVYGVYDNRRVSVVFGRWRPRRACEAIIGVEGGLVNTLLRVEGGNVDVLVWPHVAQTTDGRVVVSFWGVYAPLLYEGGLLRVRGLKGYYCGVRGCIDAVIVGVSEERTSIEPLS